MDRSVRNLHAVGDRLGKDFTTVVVSDLSQSSVRDGRICWQQGPGGINGAIILDWRTPRFDL